jgi:hypothetical protein
MKCFSQVKILHKPWLSERDAVLHVPSFSPQFGDAPHLDGALEKLAEKELATELSTNII